MASAIRLVIYTVIFSYYFSNNAFALCASQEELTAIDLKSLQSSMMVAALSCKHIKDYKNFMTKHKRVFSNKGIILKKFFEEHFSNPEQELNTFITTLANKSSSLAINREPDSYCNQTLSTLHKLANFSRKSLLEYIAEKDFSLIHGINACS